MSFRLVPKSVTLNDLDRRNGRYTLRYFSEVGKPALQKTICGGIYARVYCILVRIQCRRKESSRSLSHLLMSFLSDLAWTGLDWTLTPAHRPSRPTPKLNMRHTPMSVRKSWIRVYVMSVIRFEAVTLM